MMADLVEDYLSVKLGILADQNLGSVLGSMVDQKYSHAGHLSPKKHLVVYNFRSFYSVILKLSTKKELVIL